ncbi:DUF6286 domain-containing protein [Jongsikchunia kroppenstedtii]|uniref:DUF6286 domain-containing protein n=1 Tax=Jongsikchunia kroppenstedtii TaxID=1121721 RepID=UPI000366E5FA|nr:DUF6286 domain-containing protein [Jongsikchunia kroppenstedtii]
MVDGRRDARDPGGQLVLSDRVGRHVARIAALKVAGVEQHRGTLGAIVGNGRPRTEVDMSERRPEVLADIAIRWPAAAFDTAQDVQAHVAAEFARVIGTSPKRVDVIVSEVLPVTPRRVDTDEDADAVEAPSSDETSGRARRARGVRAAPGAALPAAVIAIGLLALAAIAIHDLVIDWGWAAGDQWSATAARWIGDLTWHAWMLPTAIAAVVIGAVLGWLAVAPRRRTHLSTGERTSWSSAYLRPQDLAVHAAAVARDIDGVDAARVTAGSRTITARIQLSADRDADDVGSELRRRLSQDLAVLAKTPNLVVKTGLSQAG